MTRVEAEKYTVRWNAFEVRVYVSTKLDLVELDGLIATLQRARRELFAEHKSVEPQEKKI